MLGDVQGARTVVMGLGLFGGGVAVARHLAQLGADVLVTDLREASELASSLEQLQEHINAGRIETCLGRHRIEDFTNAQVVIVNPGVPHPWRNPFLEAARVSGARLLSEMRIAIGNTPAQHVIGITGSQGKSTTTAMVHHLLCSLHPELTPRIGGNIGGSLLEDPPENDASLVLEFSSFMLHWMATDAIAESDRFTPGTALITNLSPNHLDWHETFEHYAACKNAIHASTTSCAQPRLVETNPRIHEAIDSALHLTIPGQHNIDNAHMAVHTALTHLQVRGVLEEATPDHAAEFASRLNDFNGLPHRLHRLGIFGGIECIDDSKSTTPESTLLAIEAFDDPKRTHLLAGGYDKGSDLSPIARLADTLGGLYGIGATGSAIASNGGFNCTTIEDAVKAAKPRMQPGDILLLSPGCASWDQFANYEARGREFDSVVRRYLSTPNT